MITGKGYIVENYNFTNTKIPTIKSKKVITHLT